MSSVSEILRSRKAQGEDRLIALRSSMASLHRKKRVLVVDDEDGVRVLLAELLNNFDCQVSEARDGVEALFLLKREDYDLILLDIRMPVINGVKVLKEARTFKPDARFVIITGYNDAALIEEAYTLGAITVMLKPVTLQDLEQLFNQVRT